MASFYSNYLEKVVQAEILQTRKYTYKLLLPNGRVIVKKKGQVDVE